MKKIAVYGSIIASLGIALIITWAIIIPAVSTNAMNSAMEALRAETGSLPGEGTIIVVDFSQPSFRKRLAIIDLKSGQKSFQFVAHGRNSGGVYATEFSDVFGSKKSSLGLYKIEEKYIGIHGPSLRLTGLSKNLNQNAKIRGIVIHSADYVSVNAMRLNLLDGFRIGRSEGCFALSLNGLESIFSNMQQPAFLFAYTDRQ